jgi:CDP-6-deoxy-D-xylo-4-hexulose-3-dehydrase
MEIQAAIGIEQLKDLDSFVERRINIANQVSQSLNGTSLEVIDAGYFENNNKNRFHSWMLIPIRINKTLEASKKAEFIKALENTGIESRPVLTGNFIRQPAIKRIAIRLLSMARFSPDRITVEIVVKKESEVS